MLIKLQYVSQEENDVGNVYPYVESIKVLAAYAALFYIWPCTIFRGRLKGKGLTFRFAFCSVVQIVLLNGVVLGLGLLHILNAWVVRILFFGAFIFSAGMPLIMKRRDRHTETVFLRSNLLRSRYGWKMSLVRMCKKPGESAKKIWESYKKRLPEYALLLIVILFGMAFFSNGAFQEMSYGCMDQYTHHTWVSGLLRGEVFSNGIYPEAMHCFIYSMHILFGIKLYSCVLFLAGIHVSAFFLAAYCLFKEVFRCSFLALPVLTAWLAFYGIGEKALESITRMSWTLPQEFGLYLVFLCPLFLLRYFRDRKETGHWYQDENLLLLALGIGAAGSLHFYVLILVFFSCLPVVLVYFKRMRPVKGALSFLSAVLSGMEAGTIPMLIAYALGKELEGSLQWGFHTFQGVSGDSSKSYIGESLLYNGNFFKGVYKKGYVSLLGKEYALKMVLLSLLILIACGICVFYCRKRQDQRREFLPPAGVCAGYIYITVVSAVYVFLYAAPFIGFPEFVVIDRTVGLTQMLLWGTAGTAIDFLLLFADTRFGWRMPAGAMVFFCGLIYYSAYAADFHENTYWWLRRYSSAVTVTDEIEKNFPGSRRTVVSMWDEKYQMEEGTHEELLTFVQASEEEDEYFLPTEYIFLYVEKRPLLRGQVHFLSAPAWLAKDNDTVYENLWNQSQCPEILCEKISWTEAREMCFYSPEIIDNYDDLRLRKAVCSKAYYWCRKFAEQYPAETNIYYEDEDFVCYVIHQNPDAPLNLALKSKQR